MRNIIKFLLESGLVGGAFSGKTGEYLVRLARWQIEERLGEKVAPPKKPEDSLLQKNMGAFVTLHAFKPRELRGCIGYIEPIMPLEKTVRECALHSAFGDSRFMPLEKSELSNTVVEVSVLTLPEIIEVKSPKEYLKKIEIGKDGLVLEAGHYRGVFLPQVPVEQKWNVEEYLCELCGKAGADADCWLAQDVKVYKFQTHIFSEEKPNGKVMKES
ncbi:Uncharacterised protein [Candidatus Anstonella stagnisolia]|nr:Uncharacterised protein [Candidatus Anstonella stagnisolia]